MQISSIVDIVNGELKNSPFISFVTDIKTDPNKVKQGDLFLVQDHYDIELAINNGAFALLYDKSDLAIINPEIAWIYCEDIQLALIRLMRYILTHHDLHIYHCDQFSYDLIDRFSHHFAHPVILLNNNMFKNIIALNQIQEHCFIFSTNKLFLEAIYPDFMEFNHTHYTLSNLIIHSAFETSFSHNEHYFDRLKIASLYADKFLDLYYFLEGGFDTNKLKNSTYFKPIFINKNIEIVDFGKSNKFLIASNYPEDHEKHLEYLEKIYSYSKIVDLDATIFEQEDYRKIIKKTDFNIGYISGKSYEQIVELLSAPIVATSLFQL